MVTQKAVKIVIASGLAITLVVLVAVVAKDRITKNPHLVPWSLRIIGK